MRFISVIVLSSIMAVSAARRHRSAKENDHPTCDTTFCFRGLECVEHVNKPAECVCTRMCLDPPALVCGSDGKSYGNECEMFKYACETKQVITVEAHMSCEDAEERKYSETETIEKDETKPKPMACMEEVRNRYHESLTKNIRSAMAGSMQEQFNKIDTNMDGAIDKDEFTKLQYHEEEGITEDMKMLCLEEVMAMTDMNADYRMKVEEFVRWMKPEFKPIHADCESDGKTYKDGEDIALDCNVCKCSCGNWVCTSQNCQN